jgi:hypothetical protein
MKTLYFDIDGTILVEDKNAVKSELGQGLFEAAVKKARFEKLVCVGNFGAIAHAVKELGVEYDELGVLFGLCRGAFLNEAWFRSVAVSIDDPQFRADSIDFGGNWWYVDDLAYHYLKNSGKADIFFEFLGNRICAPDPIGNGRDVLDWLSLAAL